MRTKLFRTFPLVVTCLISGSIFAQPVANNTPGFIASAIDQGALDPASVVVVNVWLKLHNEQQLDRLVEQQKQKGSPNYHQWITQDQFNAAYAPTPQEVKAVSNFLTAHNLTVLSVAENNLYVKAQGAVGDLQKAFHVQIHQYNLNGASYRSNTSDPSISDPAGGHIAAITGLDDYGFEPRFAFPVTPDGGSPPVTPLVSGPSGLFFESQCFRPVETDVFTSPGVMAMYTGNRYGANIVKPIVGHLPPCGYRPSELQTAYGLKPLYAAGLDGSGETIVIYRCLRLGND